MARENVSLLLQYVPPGQGQVLILELFFLGFSRISPII